MNELIQQNTGLTSPADVDSMAEAIRPEQLQELLNDPRVQLNQDIVRELARKHVDEFIETTGLRATSRARLLSLWGQFVNYCISINIESLPASYQSVVSYVQLRAEALHRNTLAGDVWAISTMHDAAGLKNPTKDRSVKDIVKRLNDEKAANSEWIQQATPLRFDDIKKLIGLWRQSDRLIERRDLALVVVAYTGLLRSNEVRNIKLSHLNKRHITIPITKTNHSGVPDHVQLTELAYEIFEEYIDKAKIRRFADDGYIFTAVSHNNQLIRARRKMSSSAIDIIYKRVFDTLHPGINDVRAYSTHSCRVGSAQDLWQGGVQIETIMKLGRWSSGEMVYRYSRGHTTEVNPLDSIMTL
ncbi:tyrosine-type recombinase/integrase [Photobacterium sp. ZSDE20]|uniref:Tyrosine-type recombinase/integrase n=1 Tax=Photobacterium pectinilyticum TaxID=2906793 RepID=A0ABT1N6U5_9GAMM|nr:tyrosine-type recombinase/integrase [Photobacterium sp. ZSDE20]MCQ1060460.1 tyrosine-type recombinase/integrase [Photobacterium sp. ZSDE20]MDD1826210.1 tyrosine-type recombinase/integrase [Photobacterium sp. ZSDE20]